MVIFECKYSRMDQVKFLKTLPEILLGPSLNTLSHFSKGHLEMTRAKTPYMVLFVSSSKDSKTSNVLQVWLVRKLRLNKRWVSIISSDYSRTATSNIDNYSLVDEDYVTPHNTLKLHSLRYSVIWCCWSPSE